MGRDTHRATGRGEREMSFDNWQWATETDRYTCIRQEKGGERDSREGKVEDLETRRAGGGPVGNAF